MDVRDLTTEALFRECSRRNSPEIWAEFVRRYGGLIAAVALRCARQWETPTRELVDDLIQETYVKLCEDNCRALVAFRSVHDESGCGYLKTITWNTVHDHFRSRRAAKRHSSQVPLDEAPEPAAVPGAALDPLLLKDIENGMRIHSIEERDRRIFWLYYRQGFTAKDIANIPGFGLTPKGVESVIGRITKLLKKTMRSDTAPGEPVESA